MHVHKDCFLDKTQNFATKVVMTFKKYQKIVEIGEIQPPHSHFLEGYIHCVSLIQGAQE